MLTLSAVGPTEVDGSFMSLYADYVLEREGKHTLEFEDGFATYAFLPDGRCYLEHIYVAPSRRNCDVAKQLADKIAEIAKENGCKILLGSVVPAAKNSTDSLKILLSYGFKLDSCENNFILFAKDI
jgi:GNAT superfamily N-acetyltransferase